MYSRILYVAGPYRAPTPEGVQANIDKARAAAQSLWSKGWAVICPHMNSAHMAGKPSIYMAGDLTIIERLDPAKDGLYLLQGWSYSEGSVREYYAAKDRGLTIYKQGTNEPEVLIA
jgi:hypothetical protein